MRSSSSGVPSMFSSRLVGRLFTFQGQRAATSGSSPTVGEPAVQRPAALAAQDLLDPGPRDLLHRLAQHAADRAAQPGPVDPVPQRPSGVDGAGSAGATRSPRAAAMAGQSLGSSASLGAGIASSSSSSVRASATCSGAGRIGRGAGGEGPDRSPGGDPPSRTSVTSRPSSADCRSSSRSRSSGWAQVTRTRPPPPKVGRLDWWICSGSLKNCRAFHLAPGVSPSNGATGGRNPGRSHPAIATALVLTRTLKNRHQSGMNAATRRAVVKRGVGSQGRDPGAGTTPDDAG